ncbi:rRNA maturation RNase YbeY [Patescibacteria group bacterium]|nr:rRNA maturation RNase YbeY [Patescibacteria group bacterium]
MKLEITNETAHKIPASLFTALQVQEANGTVELLLTGDNQIRKINLQYRDRDQPTDVLSFSEKDILPFAQDSKKLGQIIISVDRAKQQAKDLNQTLEEELRFLFVHGLLHLLGYDHQTPAEEKKMLTRAYKILGRNS